MPGIKTAAVICHARFLDLASFGEILGQKGYDVRYYDAGQDRLFLDGEPDVLITQVDLSEPTSVPTTPGSTTKWRC